MVDNLYPEWDVIFGSASTTDVVDTGINECYKYSDTITGKETIPGGDFEKTQYIGRYKLPFSVIIRYEKDEDNVICTICDKLSLVNCAYNINDARNGLEQELKDAIDLYLHIIDKASLNPKALEYRKTLDKIERMNTK